MKGFNHPQQTLASYFIILGYLFINGSSEESNSALHLQGYSNNELREVVLTLSPWLSCSNGLPRAVSQVVVLHLIPMVVESLQREEESSLNAAPPGCPLLSSHLLGIAAYLTTNKDSSKLMKRQMTVFTEATILQRCSVNALLRYKVEGNDEIIPEHLLDIISAFCKHESQEQEAKDGGNLSPSSGMTLDDDTVNSLQIKRTNYEQLQLLLEENGKGSTKRTGNETVKQSLVVVASLLEKATNLAGVARTCEVFGAEKLVVSDAKIVVSDVFQGIAVSAEDWLQIDEVKEDQLVPFLHDYKRRYEKFFGCIFLSLTPILCAIHLRGYSIVGLEQTDSSIDLSQSTTRLPLKCVLLLGKEKEGIPVHLLNELDMCLEIPQLGVIRSLNVHVSAAIAIWEITKQNCFTKNCN